MTIGNKKKIKIAYQGISGAYSHMAAEEYFDDEAIFVGYSTFEEVIDSVVNGSMDFAFIPVENSTAGRVFNIHELLNKSGLTIIGEHLFSVKHQVICSKNASYLSIKKIYSHPQALAQCDDFIRKKNLQEVPFGDTAMAVKYISDMQDPTLCAVGSRLAIDLYPDVKVLYKNINTSENNTTRFLILSRKKIPIDSNRNVRTSITYSTKNIPSALYKSLAGFATNNVNILKLESFMPLHKNELPMFYLEFDGTVTNNNVKQALLELSYYADDIKILGTYNDDVKRTNI